MSNANISLVQNLYAAFGRGDIAALVAGLSPDVDWTVVGQVGSYPTFGTWKGQAKVQDFFRLVAETEEFSEFTPSAFHAADDKVFVLGHYTLKIKKTGRPVSSVWCHVFTVRNGKCSGFQEFNDSAQFVAAHKG
jgi:ketosteroid isomerase-like protein